MDWYLPKITKRGNGETGNGVRVSYGNEGDKKTVMYFYFLGEAQSPFALTNRMCVTNPKNARIYFSDAEIEGVDGWKYIKDRKYGTPHISFTINDKKITETWKKGSVHELRYDRDNGMYFIECDANGTDLGRWKRVGTDIVCPNCGFSVAGIRHGEELNFCPNCGMPNLDKVSPGFSGTKQNRRK